MNMENDYADEHQAFAASRSTDYVYETGNRAVFHALDSHAETIEGDVKLPFVITGAAGCGKSALLANWVSLRRKTKHRDEFLFQHFVGCSPQSKQLAHLLHRLESALKEHFQLREMEIPTSEERLRWSLSRFLAAAGKKQFPARIVIVLDAVNCLLGESSTANTLHWLPSQLPQGVRIIVSTVELEQFGSSPDGLFDESRMHRTYTELRRRKCPTIHLQPLSVEVRHLIINSFLAANQQSLQLLKQAQQFRIVTAKASSQPLFLRTVLYALRLGAEMSNATIDQQVEVYLAAEVTPVLIARVLEMCSGYVDSTYTEAANNLRRVLTALYSSRHGLTEIEMWGIAQLATGNPLPREQCACIRRILRDFTFSVNGLRSLSHVEYAAVIYSDYIRSPEARIRAHHLMARYFGRLSPCDRKLDALPYHLEVSGNWHRLRAVLVEVRMFCLWWTHAHKREFLNLWASLTASSNSHTPIRKLVTGEFDDTMRCAQPSRPCLDLVEEYVRSVDEFKLAHTPSDDELAAVILQIGDFMLEFATLSLEEAADVPKFIHPPIPNDDLASLGVPFLSIDKDGNSILNTPVVELISEKGNSSGKLGVVDVPMKVNEKVPLCSTYFYHRWVWIQFPWVSLANCGERFLKGVAQRSNHQDKTATTPSTKLLKLNQFLCTTPANAAPKISNDSTALASTMKAAVVDRKLPQISSVKIDNMADALAKPTAETKKPNSESRHKFARKKMSPQNQQRGFVDHYANKLNQLRGIISSYRNELDQLRQERIAVNRRYDGIRDEANELSKMHLSTSGLETELTRLVERLERTERGHRMAKLLYRNYECVKLMCERHPAHSQALIDELEAKLTQDDLFIKEVQQQLRSNIFDSHDFAANNKILHRAAQDLTGLQNDMLIQRIRQREHLQRTARRKHLNRPTDGLLSSDGSNSGVKSRRDSTKERHNHTRGILAKDTALVGSRPQELASYLELEWEARLMLIQKRTLLPNLREFFCKFYLAQSLQTQMCALHDAAELRQRKVKYMLSQSELELEQVRYDSQSIVGSSSREARDMQLRLANQLMRYKHAQETALMAESLHRAAFGGIKHVCIMLGIPPPDKDTPINEIIHQVESVLESLTEERDRSAQKLAGHKQVTPDTAHSNKKYLRTPELDAALEHFETSKSLIAHRLPAKAS